MNDEFEIVFGEPDPDTNTQTVTIKAAHEEDLEFARQVFYNAIWGLRDLDTIKEDK